MKTKSKEGEREGRWVECRGNNPDVTQKVQVYQPSKRTINGVR